MLRKPHVDDVDDLLEFVGDDELMQWIGGEAGDRAVAVESVERWIARWELNGVGQFADPRNVRSIRVADKLGAEPEQLVSTHHGPAVVWVHPR